MIKSAKVTKAPMMTGSGGGGQQRHEAPMMATGGMHQRHEDQPSSNGGLQGKTKYFFYLAIYLNLANHISISQTINTTIQNLYFGYTITIANSQHACTNQNGFFVTKP